MNENKNAIDAVGIITAEMNRLPRIGGEIGGLIGGYIPAATQEMVEGLSSMLIERIAALESRIEMSQLDKRDFAELFKSLYLLTLRSHRLEKIESATAIFSNLLLKEGDSEKLSYTELDHFMRCLDALSSGALQLFAKLAKFLMEQDRSHKKPGTLSLTVEHACSVTEMLDASLLMGLISELQSWHLFEVNTPSIRTDIYGNTNITLTDLGERFCKTTIRGYIESQIRN